MNPRAALSHALSPGVSLHMDCQRDEISAADVLTALGWAGRVQIVPGFDGLATNLIRAKWAKDEAVLPALHREVVRFSMWHFGRKHWAVHARGEITPTQTMQYFAAQVLVEYDDSVCHSCHGRGVVPNMRGVILTCPVCKGIKKDLVSEKKRARALNMSQPSIHETWGLRLDFIQQEIVEIDRLILRRVRGFLEEI